MTATATLVCRDEWRRQAVRDRGLNGIDYVEVVDDTEQRVLCVHLFGGLPEDLEAMNVRVDGGERVRGIRVVKVEPKPSGDAEQEGCLRMTVSEAGDFSTYTLRLVEPDEEGQDQPFHGFDQRYASATFSFKAGCPSDLDCLDTSVCPPEERVEPELSYLAKDYASFRQLILDRLALIMPDWRERHVPDLGITLVELLAYVGDYLSYYQDAVATEAYLRTARQRISIRRHARLVDYRMHEGCNARAWVCIETDQDLEIDPRKEYFITGADALADGPRVVSPDRLQGIPPGDYEEFWPLVASAETSIQLYRAHNTIRFYTWGDVECCLPTGATRATLRADGLRFKPEGGDVVILEEVKGPKTGNPADADPAHRHPVRLTRTWPAEDRLSEPPTPLLEIEWAAEDALPFALCLSARLPPPGCCLLEDISVICGNVILVDHGCPKQQPLDPVPGVETGAKCECDGGFVEVTYVPGPIAPTLEETPVTYSQPWPGRCGGPGSLPPASHALVQDPRAALPQVTLTASASDAGEDWSPRYDLLESGPEDRHFVVEVDDEGLAHLRFGDGELGCMPEPDTALTANYRVGNGPAGNVGAGTIRYFVTARTGITLRPCNPLPAQGGTAAESVTDVKLLAPTAFRRQLERAITSDDYARLAERNPKVQRAGAALRWTGSWYEALVAIDPFGTEAPDVRFLARIDGCLHRFRRIGHDLVVGQARYVPLELGLCVCVKPHYLRGHVEAALLDALSARRLSDGRPGFFHPDNLTFGEGVRLSEIVATAQAVPGVESLTVTAFHRLNEPANQEIERGILALGPMEIAQLDNDPSFPERGILRLTLGGGR